MIPDLFVLLNFLKAYESLCANYLNLWNYYDYCDLLVTSSVISAGFYCLAYLQG